MGCAVKQHLLHLRPDLQGNPVQVRQRWQCLCITAVVWSVLLVVI
jgi:hypothetical protein